MVKSKLKGIRIIERNNYNDLRGDFSRLFCSDDMDKHGWKSPVSQVNFSSTSNAKTIRGMHFQHRPNTEMKIVCCIKGSIFDVIVDIRKDSKTFLHWEGYELSESNRRSILIPEGFAHGFQSLENGVEMIYFNSEKYNENKDGGLNPTDPKLGIIWPLPIGIMSEKDRLRPYLDVNFEGI
jgi:dTDP-4-dehydrorhamnose 3,5-epimerase